MGRCLAIGLLVVAVLAAGCGGGSSSSSNGEAAKSGSQVLADARAAAIAATAVHVFGTFTSAGKKIAVDFVLGNDGGKGSLKQGNARADVVRVGKTAYMRASLAFWRLYGAAGAASLLQDKWLKGSATKQPFAAFGKFLSMKGLIGGALKNSGNHGKLTNLGEKTYKGQKVVAIKDSKDGSILYVAATGAPYPVGGVGAGALGFEDWNKQVPVSAPKGAVDISQFGG
jgi:hypothetical protein